MTNLAGKRVMRYILCAISVSSLCVFFLVVAQNAVQAHWLHHSPSNKFEKQKISGSCDRHYQLFGVTTSTATVSAVEQPKNIIQQHTEPMYMKHHHRDQRPVVDERITSKSVCRCDEANWLDGDDDNHSSESMLDEKEHLAMCNSISASSTVLMASDGCGCQFFLDDTSSAFF